MNLSNSWFVFCMLLAAASAAAQGNVVVGTEGVDSGVELLPNVQGNSIFWIDDYNNTLRFSNGGAPGSNPMVLTNGGNLGIGTESLLGEKLNVQGNSGAPADGSSNTGVAWFSERTGNNGINLGFYYLAGQNPYGWIQSQFLGSAAFYSFSINPLGGNVGIGTTSPGAKLEVAGNLKLSAGSGASITFPDNTTQATAWTGSLCGGDYAESVGVNGDRNHYEPGDVLIIDPENSDGFKKSAQPYSMGVSGIYSTQPGVVGRRSVDPEKIKDEIPMAMVGIVPTKVSVENGPIKRGDLLVTSSLPGHAMKGTDRGLMFGAVVGKALGNLDSGTGVIDVLVTLQ